MRDIFEDMRDLVGCTYISDLPYRPQLVKAQLKHLTLRRYPRRQLEDFAKYIFGTSDYSILSDLQRNHTFSEPTRLAERTAL